MRSWVIHPMDPDLDPLGTPDLDQSGGRVQTPCFSISPILGVPRSGPVWGPGSDPDLDPIRPKSGSYRLEMLPFLTYLAPLFHPYYIIINYYK